MFKQYYEGELEFLREMGGEFARAFPGVAAELGMGARDPDVERLLEGFAFLTARIRQSMDAEFPELLYPLLNQIWPFALRPLPAVCTLSFNVKPGMVHTIYRLERGTTVQSVPVEGTRCTFRTCYNTDILPVVLDQARLDATTATRTHLHLRLRPLEGASLRLLGTRPLRFFLHGSPRQTWGLYLWLLNELETIRVKLNFPDERPSIERFLPKDSIRAVGWREDEALLPYPPNSIRAYRHLHEYFLFPTKHLFLEVGTLDWLAGVPGADSLELFFELEPAERDPLSISPDNIRLNCVPAINLFPCPAHPLKLDMAREEYLLKPEAETPSHFDIFSVEHVEGYMRDLGRSVRLRPFFDFESPPSTSSEDTLHYQVRNRPSAEVGNNREGRETTSGYPGVDTYLTFVDLSGQERLPAVFVSADLSVTNRDLPKRLKPGDISVPTTSIPASLSFSDIGPISTPAPAPVGRDGLWRFFSHLCLGWNYPASREALNGLLSLYHFRALVDQRAQQGLERLQNAVEAVETVPQRRVMGHPPTVLYGTRVTIRLHESAFSQAGELYLFGSALHRFLCATTAINSFVELLVQGEDQGVEYFWKPMAGEQGVS